MKSPKKQTGDQENEEINRTEEHEKIFEEDNEQVATATKITTTEKTATKVTVIKKTKEKKQNKRSNRQPCGNYKTPVLPGH